jgi:hypothetical protein
MAVPVPPGWSSLQLFAGSAAAVSTVVITCCATNQWWQCTHSETPHGGGQGLGPEEPDSGSALVHAGSKLGTRRNVFEKHDSGQSLEITDSEIQDLVDRGLATKVS